MVILQLSRWTFHTKTLCSRLYSIEIEFYLKQKQKSLFEQPFGELDVTYALHVWLFGKPIVDFLFVIIELFFAISYG